MRRCDDMEAFVAKERARKARERGCFWTWPFGHCGHWHATDRTYFGVPVIAAKCCRCGSSNCGAPAGSAGGPIQEDDDV